MSLQREIEYYKEGDKFILWKICGSTSNLTCFLHYLKEKDRKALRLKPTTQVRNKKLRHLYSLDELKELLRYYENSGKKPRYANYFSKTIREQCYEDIKELIQRVENV